MIEPRPEDECVDRDLCDEVGAREARKLRARRQNRESVWFGLGMMGLVGWSVAVPTLVGLAIGWAIDNRLPTQYSFTLMLLFAGVVVGCLNAWHWIARERRAIEEEREDGADE